MLLSANTFGSSYKICIFANRLLGERLEFPVV